MIPDAGWGLVKSYSLNAGSERSEGPGGFQATAESSWMVCSQGSNPAATRARPSVTYNHDIMYDDDPEAPDPSDMDDGDDLVTCPECGEEVYAESDRCPSCGHWIVEGSGAGTFDLSRPHRNTKLIAVILLLLLLISFLWVALSALLS